jgi:hypothetical protein
MPNAQLPLIPDPAATPPKPYGWEVEVSYLQQFLPQSETYHFRGCSEAAAKRKSYWKAVMKRHSSDIVGGRATPLDQETWFRAYGSPGRM